MDDSSGDRSGTRDGDDASGDRSAPLPDAPGAESVFRAVDGVELHAVLAGDPGDPLVVLLHGFPEFWYAWRDYVAPLVAAGYRVLVPDGRGYNRSDRPDGVRPYRRARLARDVRGLIRATGRSSAAVVGHDWGGGVAWDLALRHPDAVDRLAAVNAPHPRAFRRALRSNLRQLRRSWYFGFFQVPRVPEWLVARDDFAQWVDALRGTAEPGTFTDEDVACYRRAWRREGAPRAMIAWYRAAARYRGEPARTDVEVPALVVWGEDDAALVPELADRSLAYCTDGRVERFPDAGHWVTHERTDAVGELLVEFLDEGE